MCAVILLAAAIPGVSRLQDAWDLLGGARSLESSLQWGRMHAISANAPILFRVGNNKQRFFWEDPVSGDVYAESVRRLAQGVLITVYPKHPLRFYPHGNAAPAGTYRIEGKAGSYSVIVSPGGRIRMQKN